jgi:exosortase
MCLFVFAVPLNTLAETMTFPLRMLATKASCFLAGDILGINVVNRGTQIFDPSGSFQFEVAAACSGLRSLTAIMALCTIYAFMNLACPARRIVMLASGFPLAVLANVVRLLTIIIVSEAFGQRYGQMVHDSTWFSLLPYVPAIFGVVAIGRLLKERPNLNNGRGALLPTEQTA